MIFLLSLYLMGIPLSYAYIYKNKFFGSDEILFSSLIWFLTIPAIFVVKTCTFIHSKVTKLEKRFKEFLDKISL